MSKIKLCSWNINGLRAVSKKGFFEWLETSGYHVVCLQEIKALKEQLEENFLSTSEYPRAEFFSAQRKGYSGVANYFHKRFLPSKINFGFDEKVIKKILPRKISKVIEDKFTTTLEFEWINEIYSPENLPQNLQSLKKARLLKPDEIKSVIDICNYEGRVLESEFELSDKKHKLLLFNIYFPNGGMSVDKLKFKLEFYEIFLAYIQERLQETPYIIITGDYNIAHHEIDIARPKENLNNTGFKPIERIYLDFLEELGFIDTFRYLHPQATDCYTWWSFRAAARVRNVGWRIDYFFVSPALKEFISQAEIHPGVTGSDHCPLSLTLDF